MKTAPHTATSLRPAGAPIWSDDYTVKVYRTGRLWRPWRVDVRQGVGIFGEPGCDWNAWTRERAIRKGLRVVAGAADFGFERSQQPAVVIISEKGRGSS